MMRYHCGLHPRVLDLYTSLSIANGLCVIGILKRLKLKKIISSYKPADMLLF